MGQGGGGNSGSSTSTVVNKADPWAGQQPYLLDLWGKAQGMFNATSHDPKDYYAGMNPTQTKGWDALTYDVGTGVNNGLNANNNALSQMTSIINGNYRPGPASVHDINNWGITAPTARDQTAGAILNTFQSGSSADQAAWLQQIMNLTPQFNETTSPAAMEAALNPLTKQLTENILPNFDSAAAKAGAYGSRAAIGKQQVLDNYTKQATDTLAGMQNTQQLQNQQLRASVLQGLINQGGSGYGLSESLTQKTGAENSSLATGISNSNAQRATDTSIANAQMQLAALKSNADNYLAAQQSNQNKDVNLAQLNQQGQLQGTQQILQAMGLLPGITQNGVSLGSMPGQLLLQQGGALQQDAQGQLDAKQKAIWAGLAPYMQAVQGFNAGGTSTGTTNTTSTGGGGAPGVLTGALGGGLVGGMLAPGGLAGLGAAGGLAAAAPWLLGGAAIGGLLGLW